MAVVGAARRIAYDRVRWVPEIARSTGLSREGVELAFDHHLETDPPDADIDRLVQGTETAPGVHVILSANVFVGALRAIALARAAAPEVSVHASKRDPVFARALVEEMNDPRTFLADVPVETVPSGEVHVYGRDATIAEVRRLARRDVVVRGHGAGMGIVCLSPNADLTRAASGVASDVVAFDQRGCLSPRVVFVEGSAERARAMAGAIHAALERAGREVPRGAMSADEKAEASRYLDTMAFAGTVLRGGSHGIGVSGDGNVLVPPPGRYLHVVAVEDVAALASLVAPIARHVVAMGTDDADRFHLRLPAPLRVTEPGRMQRPPLDGPVDLRSAL